jgi:hypothetical protein
MIAKGNLHSGGVTLAAYLVKAHPGERGELIDMRGFGPVSDLRDGFRIEQIRARDGTKAEKPFFHVHFRGAHGEGSTLSRDDWREIADRCDKALGPAMVDQPRAASLHVDQKTGDMHLHLAYSLVRESENGQLYVEKLGLYKNKLKGLARELEKDYGLKIIGNDRQAGDLARAAGRDEFEESRRLGTDIKAIRAAILDSFEKSDNCKAFKAALGGQGYELANGDRRDCFVVIDRAGGQHALNKKLTGMTLAETRNRLADLDRSQLPGVEQAKELQAQRQLGREAAQTQKHGRGAEAAGQGTTLSDGHQRGPQVAIKPLGKTAGEIRLAWSLSRSGADFARGIEERGLILVHVSAEEARASERAHAFAKAINRQNRALKEGFAVVDQRSNVTRIDQRTTGDQWEEIQKRLGGIDPASLLSAAAAREVMREANRAEWAEQQRSTRESERPATGIETTIADALKATMTGHEFADALDKAGLTVTRATASDVQALDALRRDDELAATAGIEASGWRFANLEIGDFAAVTKSGEVFRLNPAKLDFAEIEQRLADVQPRMASVTEARAFNQINREQTAELWAERRAENTARRVASSEARDADREIRAAAASVQHEKQEIIGTAERMVDAGARALGGMLGGLTSMISKAADFLADIIAPPPPPTKDQAERIVRVAEETHTQDMAAREAAEYQARLNDLLDQIKRDDERERQTREREDYDRERERER